MSEPTSPPPVPHHANCCCNGCCAARAAEVRRRIEDVRREQKRIADVAAAELAPGGIVFAPLKKPQPGTRTAIVRRYGKVGS